MEKKTMFAQQYEKFQDGLLALRAAQSELAQAKRAKEETMARALAAWDRFDQSLPVQPWLRVIMIRLAVHDRDKTVRRANLAAQNVH